MKTIYYNSEVAKHFGKNGIIKAVLLNYIYNYHKPNIRKGAGYPACISLAEFVYQYKVGDDSLWGRSWIHEMLKDLEEDKHLVVTRDANNPVYAVSPKIAELLSQENAKVVSFILELAVQHGIHIAIMHRYLLHIIDRSPNGVAYNLQVKDMAEVNRLSSSQIYKAIRFLIEEVKVLKKVKSPLKKNSRSLNLTRC